MNWDLFWQLIGYGAFCTAAGITVGWIWWRAPYWIQSKGWGRR